MFGYLTGQLSKKMTYNWLVFKNTNRRSFKTADWKQQASQFGKDGKNQFWESLSYSRRAAAWSTAIKSALAL